MRTIRRIAATTIAAALVTLGLIPALPAAAAAPIVLQIGDAQDYEFAKNCSGSPTFQCNTTWPGRLNFYFTYAMGSGRPSQPLVVGYQIVDITTTAGQDYQVPTSGTITIPAGNTGGPPIIQIPLVNDGFGEQTETLRVRMTSSSEPANISDTGTGTVLDGSQIPADCSLAWVQNDVSKSLTCGNRPAGQRWRLHTYCLSMGGIEDVAIGNTVTGNGTSTARCSVGLSANTFFVLL